MIQIETAMLYRGDEVDTIIDSHLLSMDDEEIAEYLELPQSPAFAQDVDSDEEFEDEF